MLCEASLCQFITSAHSIYQAPQETAGWWYSYLCPPTRLLPPPHFFLGVLPPSKHSSEGKGEGEEEKGDWLRSFCPFPWKSTKKEFGEMSEGLVPYPVAYSVTLFIYLFILGGCTKANAQQLASGRSLGRLICMVGMKAVWKRWMTNDVQALAGLDTDGCMLLSSQCLGQWELI